MTHPDSPDPKPAHSSSPCERTLPDLRYSQRCCCRYRYCVDWLTVMDASEERTASKFKVISPRRQHLNTDVYHSDSSVQNERYAGPRDSDVKTWPVLKDPSINSHLCYRSTQQTATSSTHEVPTEPADQLAGTQWKILFVPIGFQGRKKNAVRRLKRTPYVETASVRLWPKPFVSFSRNSVSLYKSLTSRREFREDRWGCCHTSRRA